jgi:predicted amidohydrolase
MKNHIMLNFSYILLLFLFPGFFFVSDEPAGDNPRDWQFSTQRETLAPIHYLDEDLSYLGQPTLVLAGNGKSFINGHWYQIIEVEQGGYYLFSTHYLARRVEEPSRCVLARVLWLDEEGRQIGQAEYPALLQEKNSEGWNEIRQVYLVPDQTFQARIELTYRWDDDGIVHFGGSLFQKVESPSPRKVNLATIHHRPVDTRSSTQNLEQFKKLISEAGERNADIVCLPEGITLVGTPLDYVSASESVPGPTTRYLGDLAKKYHMYIVAGILERDGEVVYNTAILLNRKGELTGKYRKLSLPREEIEGGVTPGNTLPVFDTDFGRIGIMICWDVTFPETARALAMKGAEVIFLPIWGGNLTLAKARAIENQVYLVSSTYDMKSAIFDLEGEIIEEATEEYQVVVTEVDLNQQKLWPWLGDFKNRIRREMPAREALNIED